ncbi:MAG: CDP-diacylglycerol--serine O-phosphatidyltransferase [Bacteroidetes bacterium]|nr:CDP-diacylglycerol--serine O-phosphatidyltransferase [Bacteroidota bacterium]
MQHLPNSITLLNALAGCCASICLYEGAWIWAIGCIAISGFADFADGLVARALRVSSPVGKELDSMADMVSFGFVPGLIAYCLLNEALPPSEGPINWLALPGFLLTLFAALRLAKFNLDERQTQDFIGLPTPSCTLFFTGLLAVFVTNKFGLGEVITIPWILYLFILLFSLLMVAELPMFSFKFKQWSWKGNEMRYTFALATIILLILLREAAFSIIILFYILLASLRFFTDRGKPDY